VQSRVIAGSAAAAGTYPWQVALIRQRRQTPRGQFCGGTCSRATRVLTAWHCVLNRSRTAVPPASEIDVLATRPT
jgi:secreted trypsin-like serine protease